MLEKRIKDEYKLGQRQGITELDDYFYMPVRITGSGYNIRKNRDDEIILADRNQAEFFSPAFIEHCKSLPIIVNHPDDKDMLHSENLQDNAIIGNTIDAFIKGDELWGIARIYDKTLLSKIAQGLIKSTSPGVRIVYANDSDPIVNTEIPYDINHLAFCEKGHWDKDGQSIGFDNSKHERIHISFNANDSESLTSKKDFDNLKTKLNKKGEALMQTEKANDIAPAVAGALGGAAAAKVTDGELEIKHNTDEPQGEDKVKANDAYESNENKLKHSVQNSGTPSITRDSDDEGDKGDDKKDDEGEKANDADITPAVGKSKNLEKAASLMATASHAGLPSQKDKQEAKEVKAMPEIEEKEEKKQEEKKQEEKKDKANDEELVDSANETEDDKERESELKEMRKVCDSADANLGVKMPYITGRQTLRSIAHKFVTANKGFVDKKYANLALDSYTPELAKEVLQSTYANIMAKSEVKEPVKQNGYVLQPDGSFVKFD